MAAHKHAALQKCQCDIYFMPAGCALHGADGMQAEEHCNGHSQPLFFLVTLAGSASRSMMYSLALGQP